MKRMQKTGSAPILARDYTGVLSEVASLIEAARGTAARSVNAIMTATYWLIGRRIIEHEQSGQRRAGYGEALIKRLAEDLSARFGRGFGFSQLKLIRQFYQTYPHPAKSHSAIGQSSKGQSLIGQSGAQTLPVSLPAIACAFPLPWTHYVRLLRLHNPAAHAFYEEEALRAGWTVRQLNRQINSMFYERTALSRDKAAMLRKGGKARPEDAVTPEEEIKDPLVLEFLNLKDEYSETELEDALIRHLEAFLLELGGDFCFIGRQRRLRVGNAWYRVDLVFFHRRLRCLVVIDLKMGEFTHADAGQMHLYLNYAREHWTRDGENPPVGLILCAEKDEALAHYALENLPSKILAAEYRTLLPDEKTLAAEIAEARRRLENRAQLRLPAPPS